MAALLHPRAVRPGDIVAVAALSGGLEPDEVPLLEHGVQALEQLGYRVRVSPLVHPGRRWWWAAARPDVVVDEFNRLLRDPEVRAILPLTGGRMTFSYLDRVDYAAVRADPKPVLGFSDLTGLQLALHSRTGLVTPSSDFVTHGFGLWHECDDDRRAALAAAYLAVLGGTAAPGPLPVRGTWECWRPGRAEGPLVGGFLNRLLQIQASPYALGADRFEHAVLFWEENSTSTPVVWNALQVLRSMGVLDSVAAMVVGPTSTVTVDESGPALREVVLDALGDRDVPVLGNVDIGHAPPNVPLPLGVRASVDADARTLSLLEPAAAP
jgi:muramoyltetrapeptide carboxypeptidase